MTNKLGLTHDASLRLTVAVNFTSTSSVYTGPIPCLCGQGDISTNTFRINKWVEPNVVLRINKQGVAGINILENNRKGYVAC